MSRRVLGGITAILFLLFVGCSEKNKEMKPIKSKDLNLSTVDKKIKKNMMVIQEEFIPEHIKHSHIEVIPH